MKENKIIRKIKDIVKFFLNLGMKHAFLFFGIKHHFIKPNKTAIFIFGFQKSGTSAIAGLLAKKTNKSVTIDTKYLWEPYRTQIMKNELDFKRHVERYSYDFSKYFIKEPSSTFFISTISSYFKLDTYIFIVRNPFDNIRSILNRLDLPGNLENISITDVMDTWQYIFEETNGKNYISVLAERWVLANNQKKIIESPKCILVKYEDFNINKEPFIEELAVKIGLNPVKSIGHIVNKQFQPKGNPHVNLNSFFGNENYLKIKDICGDLMTYFDYEIR